jgi:hypothetical protein
MQPAALRDGLELGVSGSSLRVLLFVRGTSPPT